MPKIDISKIPVETNTNYPEPFWKPIVGRQRQRLGNAVGLSHFGVNLTTLKPGAWSSQRHWHAQEDEFIYVIEGEITLIEDHHAETVLKPGDAAGWKAGSRVGHHLINKTQSDVRYIEIGTRSPFETAVYPDIDMRAEKDKTGMRYVKKTGEAYPVRKG